MWRLAVTVVFLVALSACSQISTADNTGALSQSEVAANLYRKRCVLCHGLSGLGEGLLPMVIKKHSGEPYPDTSLMLSRFGDQKSSIRNMISDCKSDNPVAAECAPFGDELSAAEIDMLTNFVVELRTDNEVASQKVMAASNNIQPLLRKGSALYRVRCLVCHGESGKGDGRMARLFDPRPANFTESTVSDDFIMDIVMKGGEEMGRSSSMPVFEGSVDEAQVKSIILFLKTLRESHG